jgi:hypothetical protein
MPEGRSPQPVTDPNVPLRIQVRAAARPTQQCSTFRSCFSEAVTDVQSAFVEGRGVCLHLREPRALAHWRSSFYFLLTLLRVVAH